MQDINKPVRDSFYTLLNSNLSYDSTNVPVSDEILKQGENANNYVLLKNQIWVPDQTKTTFDGIASIVLDIVDKSGDTITHDRVDIIAGQILTLLFPTPSTHSLPTPPNWQFLAVIKTDDRYLTTLSQTSWVVRRLMTFSLRVVQN
jgi:hypothetical protein